MQDRGGINVEKLLVEGYAPEVAFGGAGGGRGTAAGAGGGEEAGGAVRLDFAAGIVGVLVEG